MDGTLYGISQNQNRYIKWIETCISGYFIHTFVTNNNNLSIYERFGAFIWQKVADSKLNVAEWTLDSKQKLWFFHSYQKLSCHAACTYSAQNFSISCSFFGYFEKPYVGVPPPTNREGWRPSYRKSWIRPWHILHTSQSTEVSLIWTNIRLSMVFEIFLKMIRRLFRTKWQLVGLFHLFGTSTNLWEHTPF